MRDAVAHQNFLNKKSVAEFKDEMNEKSVHIFKIKGKDFKIWKPDRLIMSKQMKDVIEKTT